MPWVLLTSSSGLLAAQLLVRGPLVVNQMFLQQRLGHLQQEADVLSGHIVKVDGLTRINYPTEVMQYVPALYLYVPRFWVATLAWTW